MSLRKIIHKGPTVQYGRGIGGIFSSLFKLLVPALKTGISAAARLGKAAIKNPKVREIAKIAGKNVLTSGINAAGSFIAGEDARKNLKKNIKAARKEIGNAVKIKKRRRGESEQPYTPRKRKRLKKQKSIFD